MVVSLRTVLGIFIDSAEVLVTLGIYPTLADRFSSEGCLYLLIICQRVFTILKSAGEECWMTSRDVYKEKDKLFLQ
jgi:hypothetical protein